MMHSTADRLIHRHPRAGGDPEFNCSKFPAWLKDAFYRIPACAGMTALCCVLLFPIPAHAAEPAYTPPSLFGTQTETKIIDVVPLPTAPPPMDFSPPAPAPIAPLDSSANISLEESASVAERVGNPVQTKAPINADMLLDHPADRVAPMAQTILSAPGVAGDRSAPPSSIPDFASYDAPPKPSKQKPGKVEKDMTIPQSAEKRSVMRPVAQKMVTGKPGVAVYSRDTKTGEFRRVDREDQHVTGGTTMYRAQTIKTERPRATAAANDLMPALPPAAVEPIALDELSTVLAVEDTSGQDQAMPLPLGPMTRTAAATEPASGKPSELLSHVRVPFTGTATDLDPAQQGQITAQILDILKRNPGQQIDIQAITAPGTKDAQRLSLARALAVRQYLKDQGIETERMTVRVLGANPLADGFAGVNVLFR